MASIVLNPVWSRIYKTPWNGADDFRVRHAVNVAGFQFDLVTEADFEMVWTIEDCVKEKIAARLEAEGITINDAYR